MVTWGRGQHRLRGGRTHDSSPLRHLAPTTPAAAGRRHITTPSDAPTTEFPTRSPLDPRHRRPRPRASRRSRFHPVLSPDHDRCLAPLGPPSPAASHNTGTAAPPGNRSAVEAGALLQPARPPTCPTSQRLRRKAHPTADPQPGNRHHRISGLDQAPTTGRVTATRHPPSTSHVPAPHDHPPTPRLARPVPGTDVAPVWWAWVVRITRRGCGWCGGSHRWSGGASRGSCVGAGGCGRPRGTRRSRWRARRVFASAAG